MVRALITGAAGFFGHHLIGHLLEQTDWEIVALVRLSKVGSLRRLTDIGLRDRVTVVHHDLRSPINAFVAAEIGQIDHILHVGAETHVDRSIADPLPFVESNVLGTTNLLQYALGLSGLRWFNYFSTDEVYGPILSGRASREGDPYNARNPYAASKAAGECIALSFANTYGLPVFITNTMNLFGERQHPEKFIPTVIRSVWRGDDVTIHADPTCTIPGSRFYLHASDAAAGLVFALGKAEIGQRYNIVGEREVNNLDLAQTVASLIGKPLKYHLVDFHSSRPGHDLRYALSDEKMRKLGWQPPSGFQTSLERTVEWTLHNPQWLLL